MNKPLISVIVPVYNVEKYLDRCLDSIVNQTYKNIEIIVINDGSLDNCPKLCDEWAQKDTRIKVIHKKNGGVSSARNAGLDACTGLYIGFVDGDDWIAPNMIETLMSACVENGTSIAVCGRYDVWTRSHKYEINKCPQENTVIDTKTFVSNMFIGKNCDSCLWDKIYNKTLWEGIRFPHGKIYEDIAVLYKVILKTSAIATVNAPLYYYYRRSNSITSSNFSEGLFTYPENTRILLNDIKENYEDLYEYACWAHVKALQAVLNKLAKADKIVYKTHIGQFKDLARELRQYIAMGLFSNVFKINEKFHLCFFSVWFILRPALQIKKTIKKLLKKNRYE